MKRDLGQMLADALIMRPTPPGLDAHAFVQSQGVGVPTGQPWTPHANMRADAANAIGRAGLSPAVTQWIQGATLGHNGQEEIKSPISIGGYHLMPLADMTPAGYAMDGASDLSNGNYVGAGANALGAAMGAGALMGPGAKIAESVGDNFAMPIVRGMVRKTGEKIDDIAATKTARRADEQFNSPPQRGTQYAWR